MPNSTIPLSRTINAARRFINQAPLTFTGTNEPAFSMADWVRGFILSPPFKWRWNRAIVSPFTVSAGTQDYTINLPKFGWLEQAVLVDTTVTPNQAHQLLVALNLGEDSTINESTHIAARLDDGNGNITFRLTPPPDKSYTLNITYQQAAPIFKSVDDYWTPIPDYLHFIVHSGMLAKTFQYIADERWAGAMQLFVRQVLGASEGLSQSQINIFLADQVNSSITQQSASQNSDIGNRSRSLS